MTVLLKEFISELDKSIQSNINNVHTALPGKITAIDIAKACVSVQPYGKFLANLGKKMTYPVLTEVPLVFPMSTSVQAGIAFPVSVGDDCLVIISEVELDEFLSGSESEGSLKFDLSSAIAIPGLAKAGNQMFSEAMNGRSVVIKNGGTTLSISGGTVSIQGNLSVNGNISCTGSFPCNA